MLLLVLYWFPGVGCSHNHKTAYWKQQPSDILSLGTLIQSWWDFHSSTIVIRNKFLLIFALCLSFSPVYLPSCKLLRLNTLMSCKLKNNRGERNNKHYNYSNLLKSLKAESNSKLWVENICQRRTKFKSSSKDFHCLHRILELNKARVWQISKYLKRQSFRFVIQSVRLNVIRLIANRNSPPVEHISSNKILRWSLTNRFP